jgi:kynurenine formamidase
MTTTPALPSQDEVLSYFKSLSNWGRWGPDDQRGTLNLITPDKIRQAGGLIRDGVSVSCERPIPFDGSTGLSTALHYMTSTGESHEPGTARQFGGSGDFFGIAPHGYTITHMDAHSHIFWEGYVYNGKPAKLVTSRGAGVGSIEVPAEVGVVSRGVLLDIARLRNVKWLENGTPVMPEDLEEAERAQGVRVEEGDILFVRTGHYRHGLEEGPAAIPPARRPGIQVACLPWLHERGVAVIGGEGPEVTPSGYDLLQLPVHAVAITAMGLYMIDAANFDDLAKACEERNRWEFFTTIAPLKLVMGTGCPVNPIAVF